MSREYLYSTWKQNMPPPASSADLALGNLLDYEHQHWKCIPVSTTFQECIWEMSVDGILGDALSHLPLHLSSIPHFHSLSSSAWSALLKLLTPALLLQGSHDASTGAHCRWGRPHGRGDWAGAAHPLWEGCDELQPRSSVSVKILKALPLITQVRAEILCCSGKENNIDYNHTNTTINKSHSCCRLRLGRHKMVENSMEVRSTCAFHIITKITPKRMKNLCQG